MLLHLQPPLTLHTNRPYPRVFCPAITVVLVLVLADAHTLQKTGGHGRVLHYLWAVCYERHIAIGVCAFLDEEDGFVSSRFRLAI